MRGDSGDGGQSDEGSPDEGGERWERLDELLDAALDLPEEEREAHIRQACGDDAELLADALRLLNAASASDDFLARSALEDDTELAEDVARRLDVEKGRGPDIPDLAAGSQVGPYRIGEVLGRGGLGTVYRGSRADGAFHRDVAIKVMRGLGDTHEMGRRFRAEREILAALQHPNIADILDGGTLTDGRPYLVMERVDGSDILEYAEDHGLSLEDRVRLFLQVARAVQYAHRHLVVHRDLKPSNILVDRNGTVKLVDFGIAKLLDDDLIGNPAPRTRTHFHLLTPEYAAPEQVRGDPVTTATDVYQLGLLLQELLTGRKPRSTEADSPAQLERVVCQEGEDGPMAAAPSRRLRRAIRGDLDTIALKALRTEPERRYASAGELAEDLDRYLMGQPVGARPEHLALRLRRTARRHPVGMAVAAGIAVLAGVQMVTATVYADRVAAERDAATQEAEKAQSVQGFLVELLQGAEPDGTAGEGATARDLVKDATDRLDHLQADPGVYAEVLDALGDVYRSWGEWPEARSTFQEAVAFFEEEHEGDHPHLADALNALGHVERVDGDHDAAEANFRASKEMRVRLHGREHPDVACSLNNLAMLRRADGDPDQARDLYEEALVLRLDGVDRESQCVANILNNLAIARRDLGDLEGADSLHLESQETRRAVLGEQHPDVAVAHFSRHRTLREMDRWADALTELETAVELLRNAPDGFASRLATYLNSLGFVHWSMGNPEKAIDLHRESLELRTAEWGRESEYVETALSNLGAALRDTGRQGEARDTLEEALDIHDARMDDGEEDPVGFVILANNLARLELAEGNLEAARNRLAEASATLDDMEAAPERRAAEVRALEGWLRMEEGDLAGAEDPLLDAHTTLVDVHGTNEHATREAADLLADLYDRRDWPSEADRYRRMAVLPDGS